MACAMLTLVGAAAGLGLNRFHPKGVPFTRYVPPALCASTKPTQQIRRLQPEQAAKLCGDSRTLVADVRSGAAYAEGHVALAVHIPCSGSSADVERVRAQLAGKQALVVYGETDEDAHKVASDLSSRIGRSDLSIAVIAGGWRAWVEAGLACASGPCEDCEGMLSHAQN